MHRSLHELCVDVLSLALSQMRADHPQHVGLQKASGVSGGRESSSAAGPLDSKVDHLHLAVVSVSPHASPPPAAPRESSSRCAKTSPAMAQTRGLKRSKSLKSLLSRRRQTLADDDEEPLPCRCVGDGRKRHDGASNADVL